MPCFYVNKETHNELFSKFASPILYCSTSFTDAFVVVVVVALGHAAALDCRTLTPFSLAAWQLLLAGPAVVVGVTMYVLSISSLSEVEMVLEAARAHVYISRKETRSLSSPFV